MCARRQAEILHSGAALLKPGGRLVYSTCTFAPEENEQSIANFLKTHPEFTPEPVEAPWFTSVGEGMFRLWPHKLLGEGHFVAVLRKQDGHKSEILPANGEKLPKEWMAFAKDLGIRLPEGKAILFGQSLYWAPEELPDIRGVRVLRPGLELGELKKDRFEPAHALAMASCCNDVKNVANFPITEVQVQKYLRGDTVEQAGENGWCLVCVDGYPLGWGKRVGGTVKNHYPKGLRIQNS